MYNLGEKDQLYLDDLLKPSKLLPYCEISFGLINEEMKSNLNLQTVTPYSVTDDTIINQLNYNKLIGTLEPNLFKLDGSFVLWDGISKQWATSVNVIGSSTYITIRFDKEYNFEGLSIVWSKFLNEYAVDFSIINYNISGIKINEINVTGNTQLENVFENSFNTTYRIQIKVTNT